MVTTRRARPGRLVLAALAAAAAASGLLAAAGPASATGDASSAAAAGPASVARPAVSRQGKDCTAAPAKQIATRDIYSPYDTLGWAEMLQGTSGPCKDYKWIANHVTTAFSTTTGDTVYFRIGTCSDLYGDCPGPMGDVSFTPGPDLTVQPGDYVTGAIPGKGTLRYGTVQARETYGWVYYASNGDQAQFWG
ncbi:hypothetical protein AB0I55_09000 [Actinocatenispora sera]|uniref:hypothetical protein n=1 Tax=Actinocatenispora sera TaxID=390989 RepID=UPI0033DD04E0